MMSFKRTCVILIYFSTTLLLCDCFLIGKKIKKDECPKPCFDTPLISALSNLYNLYSLPPIVQRYRDIVFELIKEKCVSTNQIPVLILQSLYIVDCVSRFNPGVSVSCVLTDYIRAAANRQNNEKAFRIAENNYYDYTYVIANNSIRLGLTVVGCPTPPPPISQTILFPACEVDDIVISYLDNNVVLPEKAKCIIKDMLNSCEEVEKLSGLAAVAAASSENTIMWNSLLNYGPELINGLKLKSCNQLLPLCCCDERQTLIGRWISRLIRVVRKLRCRD